MSDQTWTAVEAAQNDLERAGLDGWEVGYDDETGEWVARPLPLIRAATREQLVARVRLAHAQWDKHPALHYRPAPCRET